MADERREGENPDEERPDAERRAGADRRQRRSSFVERIGKARNRRTGADRRAANGDSEEQEKAEP